MFCRNCGKELKEGAVFCSQCGVKVVVKPQNVEMQTPGVGQQAVNTTVQTPDVGQQAASSVCVSREEVTERKKKKSGVGVLVVIVVVLVLLAAGGAGIWFVYGGIPFGMSEEESDEQDMQESDFDDDTEGTIIDRTGDEQQDDAGESQAAESEGTDEVALGSEAADAETNAETESQPSMAEDTAIHRYELCIEDVTWMEAWQKCREKGGYLVHINSKEEYDTITAQILAEDKKSNIFWIGALRQKDEYEYQWVNADGSASTESINGNSLYDEFWLEGEPSFKSQDLEETCLNMFYRSKEERFVWNDAPDDVIAAVSSYAGKVGYICEYEE